MTSIVDTLRNGWVTVPQVLEAADYIEMLESEALENARLLGMSGEREATLRGELQVAINHSLRQGKVIDELSAELVKAEKMCDSYANENQQLHDRAIKAEVERDALRQLAEKYWPKQHVQAIMSNAIDTARREA